MTLHYVYRCYASDGSPLYVGCTVDLHRRLREHGRDSRWACRVTKVKATVHPDRASALAVEAHEIADLKPSANVQGRWSGNGDWTVEEFRSYIRARKERAPGNAVVGAHLRNVRHIMRERFAVAS